MRDLLEEAAHGRILTDAEQQAILGQLESIDSALLQEQKKLLSSPKHALIDHIAPFADCFSSGNEADQARGQAALTQGQVGTVILAGGQGSRLRFDGPKGMFPLFPDTGKTLFQLCAEQVARASEKAGKPLQIAIMTSDVNDKQTRDYFIQHRYFGLSPKQIHFFCQTSLPLLNLDGKLFLDALDHIACGPSGNGYWFRDFASAGIAQEWHQAGINQVHIIPIDNPLANLFDAELAGFHLKRHDDISIKCILRRDVNEKVGLIVTKNGHCQIVEYSEMPKEEQQRTLADGKLAYRYANAGLFAFSMNFILRMSANPPPLPLHLAKKAVHFLDANGKRVLSPVPNAWKTETFIFDLLPFAEKASALLYPREECFAPLKNAEGEDSPCSVRKAMQGF